jgi:hypothetical protein
MVIAISMPVPVSPIEMPGRVGGPSLSPVTLKGPPARLGNHVEGQVALERAAFAKALDLGVDDARIDRLHDVIEDRPSRSMAPGAKFSIITSAWRIMSLTSAGPPGT